MRAIARLLCVVLAGTLSAGAGAEPVGAGKGRVYAPPSYPVTVPPPQAGGGAGCREQPRGQVVRTEEGATLCLTPLRGIPVLVLVNDDDALLAPPGEIDIGMAVALLADERMAPLWPGIEEILRPDGTRLRDAMIRRAQEALDRGLSPRGNTRATLESMNTGRSRAVLDLARTLDTAGRPGEALALLDRELPAPARGEEVREWQGEYDRLSNRLRYANILYLNRRYDAAAAALAAIRADPLIGADYAINARVNRAALLAEIGRPREALSEIDAAIATFGDADDAYRIEGSGRQFAWIRACALHGLGRTEEARAAMVALDRSPETIRPSDPMIALPVTSDIEIRAALCLGDTARLARLLRAATTGRPHRFGHLLQERSRQPRDGISELMGGARALAEAAGGRLPIRQIPSRYDAMLRRWSTGEAPPSP